jgi:hypothetical protein
MDAAALRALDREKHLSLVTFRKTGRAVATPVWFARGEDGRLYVFTEAASGKVKRLRNDARVRLAACNPWGRVHGDVLEGRAVRDDSPETVARAYAALRAKYGWWMRVTDFFSRLSGRYEGRAILAIEVDGPSARGLEAPAEA